MSISFLTSLCATICASDYASTKYRDNAIDVTQKDNADAQGHISTFYVQNPDQEKASKECMYSVSKQRAVAFSEVIKTKRYQSDHSTTDPLPKKLMTEEYSQYTMSEYIFKIASEICEVHKEYLVINDLVAVENSAIEVCNKAICDWFLQNRDIDVDEQVIDPILYFDEVKGLKLLTLVFNNLTAVFYNLPLQTKDLLSIDCDENGTVATKILVAMNAARDEIARLKTEMDIKSFEIFDSRCNRLLIEHSMRVDNSKFLVRMMLGKSVNIVATHIDAVGDRMRENSARINMLLNQSMESQTKIDRDNAEIGILRKIELMLNANDHIKEKQDTYKKEKNIGMRKKQYNTCEITCSIN